jgi:hypothetical protein
MITPFESTPGLIPCKCSTCHGSLTTQYERQQHEARDRRQSSMRYTDTSSHNPKLVSFSRRPSQNTPARHLHQVHPHPHSRSTPTTISFRSQPVVPLVEHDDTLMAVPFTGAPLAGSTPSNSPDIDSPLEHPGPAAPPSPLILDDLVHPTSNDRISATSHVPCSFTPPLPPSTAFESYTSAAAQAANVIGPTSEELFPPIADDNWEDEEEPEMEMDRVAGTPDAVAPSLPTPSATMNIDPVLNDENDPDPFYYPPTPSRPPPPAAEVHPNRAVYIIYLLVFWLHAQCHLPFRACNAVLVAFGLVLQAAGTPIDPPMYTTLPSVIDQLDAEPSFKVCPVCPGCLEVFPPSVPQESSCPKCRCPLFPTLPTPSQQRHGRTTREKAKPYLQFPIKSLKEQLAAMLLIPGIEDEVATSINKIKTSEPGKYTNIFDGKVCQELPGHDSSPFFSPSDEELANGELRIGVSLGVDWYRI